jgi:hypothetical protein
MLKILATILGFIPGFTSLIEKWMDNKVRILMAQLDVKRDVAIAIIQSEASITEGRAKLWGAIGASQLLTWLVIVLATPVAIYEWKVVVYDVVLGWGSTEAIHGAVADWLNSVIYSLFGSATVLATAKAWWTTRD